MNLILPEPEKAPLRRHLLVIAVSMALTVVIVLALYALGWASPHGFSLAMKISGGCEFTPQAFTLFGAELPFQFMYVWPFVVFFFCFIPCRLIIIHGLFRSAA